MAEFYRDGKHLELWLDPKKFKIGLWDICDSEMWFAPIGWHRRNGCAVINGPARWYSNKTNERIKDPRDLGFIFIGKLC